MAISDHFCAQKLKSETTSYNYFSPRIPKLKKFGHWTSGSGGEKTFKRYLTKMYVGMYRQLDFLTYRKNRPDGQLFDKGQICFDL